MDWKTLLPPIQPNQHGGFPNVAERDGELSFFHDICIKMLRVDISVSIRPVSRHI